MAERAEEGKTLEERFVKLVARAGLITSVAGAVIMTAVLGVNLYVIALHHVATTWSDVIVRLGPPFVALIGFVGTGSTWYGRWRIVRGKERYDIRDDITDQALNVPGDLQNLPNQLGCVSAANPALLLVGLLLCLFTFGPAPVDFLGGGENGPEQPIAAMATATPSPSPLVTATVALVPTATHAATATPMPTATTVPGIPSPPTATSVPPTAAAKPSPPTATPIPPTATPIPPTPTPTISFAVKPTSSTALCYSQLTVPLTLDNTGSNAAVGWSVQNLAGWATPSVASDTIPAGKTETLTLTITNCANVPINGSVTKQGTIVLSGAGTGSYAFTVIIYGQRIT